MTTSTETWTLVSTEWTPSTQILTTTHEGSSFSFNITCKATYQSSSSASSGSSGSGTGGAATVTTKIVDCTITTVPEKVRDSIIISGGSISGVLTDVFDRSITYMKKDRSYETVDGYSKIDQTNLYKMISTQPSRQSSENFNFTCTAIEVPETKIFTIVVQNTWDGDKSSLQAFVSETNSLTKEDLV